MKNTNKSSTRNLLIYEKIKGEEVWCDVFSRLVKERILFLSGEEGIGADDATSLAAHLLYLNNQNKIKPISIYINSPGGSVTDGLFTIYDTMQFIQAPIKTVCMGEACSAAAVLLSAGSNGMRLAFPNACIMIHELQIGNISGSNSEVEREAERCRRLNNKIISTIAYHTGQSFEKIKSDIKDNDFYLSAEEALKYGLIDGIVKTSKEISSIKKPKIKKV